MVHTILVLPQTSVSALMFPPLGRSVEEREQSVPIIRTALFAQQRTDTDMEALGAFARAEDVQLDRKLYTMIELEGRRYGGFFAKLDARGEGAIPRAAAITFFAKSALSDAVRRFIRQR